MTTCRAKWSSSAVVRVPKGVALAAQIGDGDMVDVVVEQGAIVIRPAGTRYSLELLVDGITRANRHENADWRMPVGREV